MIKHLFQVILFCFALFEIKDKHLHV